MKEEFLNIKSYNSESFLRINTMNRYTNDKIDGRHVFLNTPQSLDYHLYFVSSGTLEIKDNSNSFKMNKYDLLILSPKGKQELISPYMASYIHCVFSGSCAKEILDDLNLETNKIYHTAINYKSGEHYIFLNKQINYVWTEFRKQKEYSELSSTCMLIEFLSIYSRTRSKEKNTTHLKAIRHACQQLLDSPEGSINIKELINESYLSKSQFYRLFKEYTGTTPLQFRQKIKLSVAADYLILYDMKIKEVSEKLCFSDPAYFSNAFKREFGVSPKTYIKSHKTHSPIQDEE